MLAEVTQYVGFAGRDISEVELHTVGCIVRAVAPLPCRCQGSGGRGGPRGKNSFPEGTEVLTPQGKVAIEDLREGDLVIARNEETGASGTFPITGVSARQANDLLWLHLEREDGATSRMGVTTGHPMFVAGQGWIAAGELIPGDIIRNADLRELAVLAIEADDTPQRVHNLEIAEAHTYFVGELEAWGRGGIIEHKKANGTVLAKKPRMLRADSVNQLQKVYLRSR